MLPALAEVAVTIFLGDILLRRYEKVGQFPERFRENFYELSFMTDS